MGAAAAGLLASWEHSVSVFALASCDDDGGNQRTTSGSIKALQDRVKLIEDAIAKKKKTQQQQQQQQQHVVVVGGGIVGLCTAYYLTKLDKSVRVTLLERHSIGSGASLQSGGLLTKLMFNDVSCAGRKVARELYGELSQELPGYSFRGVGCLGIYDRRNFFGDDDDGGDHPLRSSVNSLLPLYDRVRARYEVLKKDEITKRWPALQGLPEDVVGLFDPDGGYNEPEELVPSLALALKQHGSCEVVENAEVLRVVFSDASQDQNTRTVRGVEMRVNGVSSPVVLEADTVIVCAHTSSQDLLDKTFGLSHQGRSSFRKTYPVKHYPHRRYVTAPLAPRGLADKDQHAKHHVQLPAVNYYLSEPAIYFRPHLGNRLMVGVENLVDANGELMEHLLPDITARSAHAVVPLYCKADDEDVWESHYSGIISQSADYVGLVGPVEQAPSPTSSKSAAQEALQVEGLYLGCGFCSGFSYGVLSGRMLAEYVLFGKPRCMGTEHCDALRPGRWLDKAGTCTAEVDYEVDGDGSPL